MPPAGLENCDSVAVKRYYDYQFCMGWWNFGDKVLDFIVLPGVTFVILYGKNVVACNFVAFAANDVKCNKLPLETVPAACDISTSYILKPGM